MLHPTTGDLFLSRADAIINTVNTMGHMGAGLALAFKKKYPANTAAYVAAFQRNELAIGRMFTFDLGASYVPRYIINFPTKKHWRDPSKLEYVEEGLVALVAEIRRLGIRSIAVPALGAGLGGLHWPTVRARIEEHLGKLSEVEVELYAPG